MGLGEAIRKGFANYANFSGRARRSEYWWWVVFVTLASAVLMVPPISFLGYVFFVGTLLPSLALAVRRLHDTNHSGWLYFISFVPVVGPFILLFFLFTDGTPGVNAHGPDPKDRAVALPLIDTAAPVDQARYGSAAGLGGQLPPYVADPTDPYRSPGAH